MADSNSPTSDSEERKSPWKLWAILVAVVTVVAIFALQYVGDPPPRRLVVGTGSASGGYHSGGLAIRDALAESGIEVELRQTAGSVENVELLRAGEIDVAFAQGGTVTDSTGLVGVASLYYEPLWVFVRNGARDWQPADDLSVLSGMRIEVGAPGSGTGTVARQLLAASGVTAADATFGELAPDAAVESLLAGDCDALFSVVTPGSPRVARLFASEDVRAFSLERALALSRHFRYLEPLLLTPGMIDLRHDLPTESVGLVAPTAALLVREELHPAVIPLLYEAARGRYGPGGLFEDEATFPNLRNLDVPAAPAAVRYERAGPSFLYRVLPFQMAATIDRLKIMLLPLLTLMLPLLRIAPPVYRWRIRSKIFRWYKVLLQLEKTVRSRNDAAAFESAAAQLEQVAEEIAAVRVPLGYAEELYNLRMHIRLVREEFAARSGVSAD